MYYIIFENQLNDDIPSEITSEITSETNNSIFQRNVFNLPEDLFIPTESNTGYDLIEIYKNNKTAEFIDIIFKNNLLPLKLLMLENLTELVIRKCPLDEISLLPVNLEKVTFNKCGLKIVSCKNFPANLKYVNFSDNRLELFIDIIPSITHLYLDDNTASYSASKINKYKSIHTSVIGPKKNRIEIQIRTKLWCFTITNSITQHTYRLYS